MSRLRRVAALCLVLGVAGAPAAFVACTDGADADVGTEVGAIVFIRRQHTTTGAQGPRVDVAGGSANVTDYDRYVPGGALMLLSPPRPGGALENITAAFPQADLSGADVSFDGKQVVFSMKRDADDRYHLYTAQLRKGEDGSFEIHQKTGGDRDDIHPIYVPGGRIAFVTNEMYSAMGARSDEYEHGRAVTQLATISAEAGDADRRLSAQNLSHTIQPWLRSDGKIGLSRWEHLGGVNDVKLFAVSPDGTGMVAVAGQHGKPGNALFGVREIAPDVMIAVTTSRSRTLQAGALVRIEAVDEEHARFDVLTPDVPTWSSPSPAGRYREPSILPDGRILVSWASGPVNDLSELSATPPAFGLYIFDPATKKNQLVYHDRQSWSVRGLAVAARREPPILGDAVDPNLDPGTAVRIGGSDLTKTSLEETIKGGKYGAGAPLRTALADAVKVRIIEGYSNEGAPGATTFGLTMDEGAAILGEAKVHPDGSWLASIPPRIPVHLQPIDKWGMAIRTERLWLQGMPGESRRCVGCHEPRADAGAPPPGTPRALAEQAPPEAFDLPIADRLEISWARNVDAFPTAQPKLVVQDLLDAKCVACHDGGAKDPFASKSYALGYKGLPDGGQQTFPIPYLDLSGRPVTIALDKRVATFPVSYVSLFMPAALLLGSGSPPVIGQIPPRWAVVNNARESALVVKLNARAADGSFAYGTPAMHPEDKGVSLTDEERLVLIRAIDVGGQLHSRQGTGFVPFAADPLAPGRRY